MEQQEWVEISVALYGQRRVLGAVPEDFRQDSASGQSKYRVKNTWLFETNKLKSFLFAGPCPFLRPLLSLSSFWLVLPRFY